MEELNRYLAAHHGVVSKAQAIGLGLTSDQVRWRVRHGAWVRLYAGVYRLASAPETWSSWVRAGALAAHGLGSHTATLRVVGVDGYDRRDAIHISTRAQRSARSVSAGCPSAIVHRSASLDRAGGRLVDGIPVTGVARAVLDTAAIVDDTELECLIDAVIRQRLGTIEGLMATVVAHGTSGRAGAGRLLRLLEQRRPQQKVPDSRFNRMVGRLLVESGLDEPEYEYEVRVGSTRFRVDLAYPAQRLAIECDSARWHHNRRSFELDPRRRNLLVAAGHRVLSFTWHDYADDPAGLVATVRAGLRDLAC